MSERMSKVKSPHLYMDVCAFPAFYHGADTVMEREINSTSDIKKPFSFPLYQTLYGEPTQTSAILTGERPGAYSMYSIWLWPQYKLSL